jgi:hypothetical protein
MYATDTYILSTVAIRPLHVLTPAEARSMSDMSIFRQSAPAHTLAHE